MSNFKQNKLKAFTLAELMVIMAVMTVVMAAVAPIFTARFSNAAFDNVWNNVGASNNNDIYSDAPIRSMMQQTLIGLTPIDLEDVRKKYQPYSKLIVRSSHKVGGNKIQKQIELRCNDKSVSMLSANANMLLGGDYSNISFPYQPPNLNDITTIQLSDGVTSKGNTAMGYHSLNSVTTGSFNTAFGTLALEKLTSGSNNTAIGREVGKNITTGSSNTLIGNNSYTPATGNYNTIIGYNSSSKSSVSNYTTAVGNNIIVKGDYNAAIGDSSNAGGYYNTAIGYGALQSANPQSDSYGSFKYNTAIGYNSCSGISASAQNTTCIGGAGIDDSIMSTTAKSLFNDTHNRVLIGRPASKYNSAATLEVHSLSAANSKYPYPDNISGASSLGDSSVIVNGNLIVRGQTFMIGRSPFPISPSASASAKANTISLMGYRLYKESKLNHKPLIGVDGSEHFRRLTDNNDYTHETINAREHCICNYSCSTTEKDYHTNGFKGRDSYDWSSRYSSTPVMAIQDSFGDVNNFYLTSHACGASYNTNSHSADNYELDYAHVISNALYLNNDYDSGVERSCCPMLTDDGMQIRRAVSSDRRLKNINNPYISGLSLIDKIKVYNYTFKSDKTKMPHVGVIAQDLKRISPDSVSKDNNGYYRIRTDELFYAAVNAIKELNSNLQMLISKVNSDIARLNTLKKENHELNSRLLLLSRQLYELEK